MSDYTPSPELVEGLHGILEDDIARPMGACDCSECAENVTRGVLTAAVAYRTPDGHPELVPWEQVRELVEAAEVMESHLAYGTATDEWDAAHAALRAALAPFTQEPQP